MVKVNKNQLKKKRTLIATLSKVPADELANVIPNLNEDSLGFLTHCFGGILRCDCRHLKLTKKEIKLAQKHWAPFKKALKPWEKKKDAEQIVRRIKSQKGGGVILSAVFSSALPLIYLLIEKALKK